MPPNNVQRFLDQNFVAIFPVFFATIWCLVCAVISIVGGWFWLSKVYRTRAPFSGSTSKMQSGQMRWFTNYNNVLTLGSDQRGLYLACMFLFRFMHPPMLIPWSEIKVTRKKGWIFDYVTFTLGHELAIPLRIRAKLAERLRGDAGSAWPIEEM